MRSRVGMLLALGAGLTLAGCAAGAGVPAGPVTSPTGVVYEPGTAPVETEFSDRATLFLVQENYEQALAAAEEGIEADTANPIHYFIAGSAQAGLGNLDEADRLWDTAERIYPAYELEIEPQREATWIDLFNQGVTAYGEGQLDAAVEAWEQAAVIYDRQPDSYRNLAIVLAQQNEYERAIQAYRDALAALERVPAYRELTEEELAGREELRPVLVQNLAQLLARTEQYAEAERLYREALEADPTNVSLRSSLAVVLSQQGRTEEAEALYGELLDAPDLGADELHNIGVALFNADKFEQAAIAFGRVAELHPRNRDVLYNYVQALYPQEKFAEMAPAAEQLVEIDPLGESSAQVLAEVYRFTRQNEKALEVLTRISEAPVHVADLQIRYGAGRADITGNVVGNTAAPGTPVQLQFTFYNQGDPVGTETVTVNAPAEDATTSFQVSYEGEQPVTGYSYELVG